MPTLTFSRFENRILTHTLSNPTGPKLLFTMFATAWTAVTFDCLTSCPLSRSPKNTSDCRAPCILIWWWIDWFSFVVVLPLCLLLCRCRVEKQALFVSFGMKKKKKEEEPKQKNDEKQTKREKPKFFRNWWTNFIILTNVNTSHLQTRRTFNLLFEKLKYLFFARLFLRKYSHIVRRPLSQMPHRVMCA